MRKDNLNVPNWKLKEWRECVKRFNFKIIDTIEDFPIRLDNVLFVTNCSKTKSNKPGIPKEFYISMNNQRFYKYAIKFRLDYAILSDKYGILFHDELLEPYDIHPSSLSMKDKYDIGIKIKEKCSKKGYSTIVYWYYSPNQSLPYFHMLYFSELTIYYLRSLNLLDMFFIDSKQRSIF